MTGWRLMFLKERGAHLARHESYSSLPDSSKGLAPDAQGVLIAFAALQALHHMRGYLLQGWIWQVWHQGGCRAAHQ